MKCGRCGVEILREHGYVQTIVHGTAKGPNGQQPAQLNVPYCTWFCAAVAFDLCCLKTLESTPMVTQMPQCQSWLAEHNGV